MDSDRNTLRSQIVEALESQGFLVNPHLRPKTDEKSALREVHRQKRDELIKSHEKFMLRNFDQMKRYSLDGKDLEPQKIDLELVDVKPKSLESIFFLWWNLAWWSLPYDKPIGRQMRFILWDKHHNAPFGLIGLQSPPLRSASRDHYLGLNSENVDYWINQSMYAQRVGALPPYNILLGAKMVTLSLASNEIREQYEKKYENTESLLEKRVLPNKLLFITTTGAYGKSSVYDRITYQGDAVTRFIGFTAGSGTFHIPQTLYERMLLFLKEEGIGTKRGYGTGPSRKLKLISAAFKRLGIGSLVFHNIKRGHYLLSNVRNLQEVIQKNSEPSWYDRPFERLFEFWKTRWGFPRSCRIRTWKRFSSSRFFDSIEDHLDSPNA